MASIRGEEWQRQMTDRDVYSKICRIADATFLFDGGYKALTRDEVVEIVKESL